MPSGSDRERLPTNRHAARSFHVFPLPADRPPVLAGTCRTGPGTTAPHCRACRKAPRHLGESCLGAVLNRHTCLRNGLVQDRVGRRRVLGICRGYCGVAGRGGPGQRARAREGGGVRGILDLRLRHHDHAQVDRQRRKTAQSHQTAGQKRQNAAPSNGCAGSFSHGLLPSLFNSLHSSSSRYPESETLSVESQKSGTWARSCS